MSPNARSSCGLSHQYIKKYRRHVFRPPPIRASTLNGYVYGGGEWSYPGFAIDSEESKLSVDAAAATGANSLEFTPMWFFDA